jgi:hypothetical protein
MTNLVLFAHFVPIPFIYLWKACELWITIYPSVKDTCWPSQGWAARIARATGRAPSTPAPKLNFLAPVGANVEGDLRTALHLIAELTGDVSSRVFA